jgi:catechol 2,3-dioxygenase-like lactoylglutathione lyase family enzyme
MQIGYVVRDWRAMAEHWSRVHGVGPFFALEHIEFRRCTFRGQPATLDMSVAIAYSGELQIELVEQHDAGPSIYREHLDAHGEGLQHVGVLVDDLAATLDAQDWHGRVAQAGETAAGQRFAYVDLGPHPGAMLELIEAGEAARAAFAHMRAAALNWNGERPLRLPRPKS